MCKAVGVADRNTIPDARMTASSTHPRDLPYYGRLNEKRYNGVWCTKAKQIKEDYLQVDMGAVHSVCAVATQGPRNEVWVKSYKLQLSTDGVTWYFYKENNKEKVSSGIRLTEVKTRIFLFSFCYRTSKVFER